ncbi:long-chain-fatty-acid--CoA ligase [Variovorax sp. LjRoot175]|uniref:long-chain-fatty-acid--CoA ligase n=1 Tax=Variovorax sp. LjRoot175 TaxID=3342276 RepID=UPI003ECFD777
MRDPEFDRLPTLTQLVRRRASALPQSEAFRTPSKVWSFADIHSASNRMAQGLKTMGLGPGDRIGCFTKQSAECVVALMAAAKIGAVCAIFNWRLTAHELRYVVQQSEARLLITDTALLPVVQKIEAPLVTRTLLADQAAGESSLSAWRETQPDLDTGHEPGIGDTVLQLNSSGTTGLPKAIEISHFGLLEQCRRLGDVAGYPLSERFVMLNALPNFHVAGIVTMLSTMYEGGTTVCYPEFVPAVVVQDLQELKITHTFLVPAMLQFLLTVPGVEKADFSSLKGVIYGGSPIAESLLVQSMKVFRCGFFQVYGMTEISGGLTFLRAEDHAPDGPRAHLLRSAGQPTPGFELKVVDPSTGAPVPEGGTGEIWARCSTVMNGYFRNPEATNAVFPEGRGDGTPWYRTGDAGCLREGFLYIQDRVKDMIVSGGENIYPAEIENVLSAHPAVAEVAVIGVPDPTWGESVKAVVVAKPGQQPPPEELIAFCREQLAGYKCPRSVDFATALPRNPTGKLLKRLLREPFWASQKRQVT